MPPRTRGAVAPRPPASAGARRLSGRALAGSERKKGRAAAVPLWAVPGSELEEDRADYVEVDHAGVAL